MRLSAAAWDIWRASRHGQQGVTARQEPRLEDTVDWARARSPLYRKLYDSLPRGDVELSRLPPVTKNQLMAAFDEWVTDPAVTRAGVDAFVAGKSPVGQPYLERYFLCTTSGSTGHPGIFLHDADAVRVYSALSLVRGYFAWMMPNLLVSILRGGNRIAAIIATGGHYAGAAWAERLRRVYPRLSSHLYIVSVLKPIQQMVEELNQFSPNILIGYPTAMAVLAEEQEAGRLRVRPGLLVPGGESLPPTARERLELAFHCPVRDTYAASEFMGIAFDCRHGWLHVNSDWAVLEPVDETYHPVPPGRTSQTVLLTSLANRVQPLIRYDLGDRITVNPDPCPCGNPFPAIRVEGRLDDILYFATPGGKRVPVLPMAIAAVVEETPGVHRYQIIQTDPAAVNVRMETAAGRDASEVWGAIATRLRDYLSAQGLGSVTVLKSPDPPARDPVSGKFREVWAKKPPGTP